MNNSVYEQLYETRKKLEKEIASLSYGEFNSKPSEDSWSIAQVCHHLVLVEKSTIKAIAWGLKGDKSGKDDRKTVERVLNRTKKLQAPRIVEPSTEPFEVQQMLDLLSESRNSLLTYLSTIEDKTMLKEKSVQHPAFGDLPLDQWIDVVYLHEQRHMEQIKEIKSCLNVRG